SAGLGSSTYPLPTITRLSSVGAGGSFVAASDANEIGSPGTIPPVAGPDSVTTAEDVPVTFNVLANDLDANADALTVIGFTLPAQGTLTNNGNGSFTYAPGPNFNGTDAFTYTIGDGRGGTATASVDITVRPVNDAPVLTIPGTQTTVEDG